MTLFAVVDKAGLETGLDAGHDTLVDIALALLTAGGFDVEVDESLPIDDGHAQLLRVRGIKQHTFHTNSQKRRAFTRRNTALVAEGERAER